MVQALSRERRLRSAVTVVALAVVASAFAGPALAGGKKGGTPTSVGAISVLSNRADLISGGDALVRIELGDAEAASLTVTLNGADVTGAFDVRENGRYEGLVTGLQIGQNVLVARPEGGYGRRIAIRNHPIGGPVFSGPQVTPFFCNPNASNPPLGTAIDAQCNAPTRVELLYRNTATPPQFVAYDPTSPPPAASIAQTTTDAGKTVPFIVQRVTGTANRGIYQIAVLVDPAKPIEPWSTGQPWSRKLFHPFGGACGNQHVQTAPSNVLQATQLGLGFAVATSSLNIYANNCSDLTSAEATMMTKEIVVERYGPLLYTMGNGGSAASMQQHLLAENYPGLLDGLTTSQVFPDHMAQVLGSLDCRLLYRYFWPTSPLLNPGHATSPPNALFPTAASRLPVWGSNPTNPDNLCGQKILAFGADRTELLPASGVACGLAAALIWSPTNPTGERCGTFDFLRSVFGVVVTPDAPNGKGRSATDNVGIQYGLKALLAGQITPEQFVDLNSKIGGIDIDGNFTPERKAADPTALEILYSTGRMNSGSGAADVPEIDNRTGGQMDDTGFHPAFETFSYRARLDRSNGHHANQIVWLSRPGGVVPSQFDFMRQWLDTLAADTSADPRAVKVQRAKPADLVDTCFMAGGVRGDMTCNGTWQHYAAPRIAAGGPLTQDVMKCQTTPLARSDYGVIAFTDDQWARLQAAYPTGVCDYTRPGVSQRPPKARWLTFEDGPGGKPLGDAPLSQGPTELLDDLTALLASYDLDKQENRKLVRSLEQVGRQLPKRNTRIVCGELGDFVATAQRASGKSLTANQAAALVAGARELQALLGC